MLIRIVACGTPALDDVVSASFLSFNMFCNVLVPTELPWQCFYTECMLIGWV